MAKLSTNKKSQLVQISQKEAYNYDNISMSLLKEAEPKIKKGVKFLELKTWAFCRKKELLP